MKHQIHREILEEALRKPEEKPNPWKKPLLVIMGLFLVVLILSYYFPELLPYLQGMAATQEINPDYTSKLRNGGMVVFDAKVYEQLKEMYQGIQTHEFKACLLGHKENQDYIITGLKIPTIYSESVYHVTAEECDSETIIDLHSHPPEHCIISEQDQKSQEYFKQVRPDSLGAVMCGENRFGFYG